MREIINSRIFDIVSQIAHTRIQRLYIHMHRIQFDADQSLVTRNWAKNWSRTSFQCNSSSNKNRNLAKSYLCLIRSDVSFAYFLVVVGVVVCCGFSCFSNCSYQISSVADFLFVLLFVFPISILLCVKKIPNNLSRRNMSYSVCCCSRGCCCYS